MNLIKPINKLLFVLITSTFLLNSTLANASGFGCSGVAGGVILKDTLYGAGVGGIIAGLVVLSKDDKSDSGKQIANGGLIGGVLGLGLGIAEIAMRDCSQPSRASSSLEPGFSFPDIILARNEQDDLQVGLSIKYVID